MPGWAKALLDEWLQAANLTAGKLFRRVNKNGKTWGDGLTEKAVWHVVRAHARKAGIARLAPHDLHTTSCHLVTRSRSDPPIQRVPVLGYAQSGSWPSPVRGRNVQFDYLGISGGRIRANNRDVVFHP